MDLETAFTLLKKEMSDHGLAARGWTAKLDDARKRFGVCRMTSREISLSRPLIHLNSEEEVHDTILHEIAHALAWIRFLENCGHDERWKRICREIGAKPERCFDEEVVSPELPWALCHRETGEIFNTYHRKPERDASQIWIRGRKGETLGKLVFRLNPKVYPEGPIESFDGLIAGELRDEIRAAIEGVIKARGLRIEDSTIKGNYESLDLSFRLTIGPGDDREPGQREFELYAPMVGLEADDFRRAFRHAGRDYVLIAIKPRNRKYPVIGMDAVGKRFKFPPSALKNLR